MSDRTGAHLEGPIVGSRRRPMWAQPLAYTPLYIDTLWPTSQWRELSPLTDGNQQTRDKRQENHSWICGRLNCISCDGLEAGALYLAIRHQPFLPFLPSSRSADSYFQIYGLTALLNSRDILFLFLFLFLSPLSLSCSSTTSAIRIICLLRVLSFFAKVSLAII